MILNCIIIQELEFDLYDYEMSSTWHADTSVSWLEAGDTWPRHHQPEEERSSLVSLEEPPRAQAQEAEAGSPLLRSGYTADQQPSTSSKHDQHQPPITCLEDLELWDAE